MTDPFNILAAEYSMIEMPYRGDKLSMVVTAPNDPAGLPSIEAHLNAANLQRGDPKRGRGRQTLITTAARFTNLRGSQRKIPGLRLAKRLLKTRLV